MQYFPVLTADEQELIFTRRVGGGQEDDEDLVVSRKDPAGRWMKPVSVSAAINSRYNEGTCSISADGRQLIFTSCVGRRGFGSCDLFESRKIGNEWTRPVNLGPEINSPPGNHNRHYQRTDECCFLFRTGEAVLATRIFMCRTSSMKINGRGRRTWATR